MIPPDPSLPIVVAGGAGFLGQSVVQFLLEQGRRCVIVDRQPPYLPALQREVQAGRVGMSLGDLTEYDSVRGLSDALPDRFQLVHMATVIETTTRVIPATQKTLDWHAGISMNLARAWRDRLASICFISSFEVYGNLPSLPIVESLPKVPNNVYGVGKLFAENCLRIFCRDLGIPLNILRLTHLYGPGELHNKAIPNFIKNCLAGRPHQLCGGGRDLREPVHVRDVAYAVWLTLGRPKNGIFNIAGGRCVSIREILDLVQQATKLPRPVQDRPADRPPLDVRFDLSHARSELGFVPRVSLEEGLKEEIDWFRSGTSEEPA